MTDTSYACCCAGEHSDMVYLEQLANTGDMRSLARYEKF